MPQSPGNTSEVPDEAAREIDGFEVSEKGVLGFTLGADPVAMLMAWSEDAARVIGENPHAMVLATSTPRGAPSARVVLCKAIEPDPPAIVFFTNYLSRKGRELEANPRAAGVFHWPALHRQARVEGRVERTGEAESDEYFRSRPLLSRAGAIASRQSEPMPSRAAFVARVLRAALTPGDAASRPPHWGGFRILLDRIEFWSARSGRLHDRIAWTTSPGQGRRVWTPTRLFP